MSFGKTFRFCSFCGGNWACATRVARTVASSVRTMDKRRIDLSQGSTTRSRDSACEDTGCAPTRYPGSRRSLAYGPSCSCRRYRVSLAFRRMNFPHPRTLVAASALLVLSTAAVAAQEFPPNRKVDQIFAEWSSPDSPGCALGVVRDGKFIYERGYGMANLDYDIP